MNAKTLNDAPVEPTPNTDQPVVETAMVPVEKSAVAETGQGTGLLAKLKGLASGTRNGLGNLFRSGKAVISSLLKGKAGTDELKSADLKNGMNIAVDGGNAGVGIMDRFRSGVAELKRATRSRALLLAPLMIAAGCGNALNQEQLNYIQTGLGAHGQEMEPAVLDTNNQEIEPGTSIAPFTINLGYRHINKGFMHGPDVNLGLLSNSKLIDAGYEVGFGPDNGFIHFTAAAGLGYVYACNNKDEGVHGLRLRTDVGINFGIPKIWLPENEETEDSESNRGANVDFLRAERLRWFIRAGYGTLLAKNNGMPGCKNNCSGWQFMAGFGWGL